MNDLEVFFLTNNRNGGLISYGVNLFLAPVRCLFHGRDVSVVKNLATGLKEDSNPSSSECHHVRSFHSAGRDHCSRTDANLKSGSRDWYKVLLSIVFILPFTIIGAVFKSLIYVSGKVREDHRSIKAHFTPVSITIPLSKSITVPQLYSQQVEKRLGELAGNPLHEKIDCLTVEGPKGAFLTSMYITQLNPKKLILYGGIDIQEDSKLAQELIDSGKWETEELQGKKHLLKTTIASVEEAENARIPRRPGSNKPYHAVLLVPGPAQDAE